VTAPLDTAAHDRDATTTTASPTSGVTATATATANGKRAAALGSALDRLVRLQRLTAQLAATLDAQRIADVVVDHVLGEVGAVTAAIWRVEGDELVLVRSNGYPPDAVARVGRVTISTETAIGDAITTRSPVLMKSWADYAARYPEMEASTRPLGGPRGAIVCLPLASAERADGVLTYAFEDEREFDVDDRTYFELLAAHVFGALERARLFAGERHARTHVEVLYELAVAAARATTLDEIFEPALDAVCRALRVERASILLFDDSGSMRFRAWRGLSSEYRAAVDGHSPWSRDAEEPKPILVGDVTKNDAMRAYLPVFEREGIQALAFVPLVHDRRLIGKFMIYCAEARAFDESDVRLAMAIATNLAQAIARSNAQDETKQARAMAEEAARARAEMVAVVAHDLRNPLGVAQLKAQLMMRKVPEGEPGQKMKKDLEVIFRNTQHMARLIGDLLDAATIEANRIAVEKTPNVVADILGEAVELVRMLADQKGLRLVIEVTPPDVLASCDRARVLQALSNLLGNAIKYTPADGEVHLTAQAIGPEVLVSVADSGPGIPAAERERVFERYVHGRQKGSVGLGLFIARGLVAAHGGRIWIEDARADVTPDAVAPRGTRVCFTLPGV
jgi:signal transduction histidine kinase